MEFYNDQDIEGCLLWDVNEHGFLELEVFDNLEEE